MRSARSQPDRVAGRVEMTISSTRKNCRAFIVAVYGSGSPIMPAATRFSAIRRSTTCAMRARARAAWVPSPPSCGTVTMNSASRSALLAFSLRQSSSSSPLAVLAATTRKTLNGMPSASMSCTTCSTGSPLASSMRSMRSRRSQPDTVAGKVETMTSSGLCSAIASIAAVYGSGSPMSPIAWMPCSRRKRRARSMRTFAASKTKSS
jgi:hypothetical protein